MAITLELLERVVISEVENLHIRIDGLVGVIDRFTDKLATLERQMSTVFLSLEEIKSEVKGIGVDVEYLKDEFVDMKENMATKNDLAKMASKDDLANFVTKQEFQKTMANVATKDDLKNFATKDDLKRFATKEDLKSFATKDDLKELPTKGDISKFVTKDEVAEIIDAAFKRYLPNLSA